MTALRTVRMGWTWTAIVLLSATVIAGCADRVLLDDSDQHGTEDTGPVSSTAAPDPATTAPGTSDSGAPPGTTEGDGGGTDSEPDEPDVELQLVGAALYADGLCPLTWDKITPAITLQFSASPKVCHVSLREALRKDDYPPTWFAQLQIPYAETGVVYDLAAFGDDAYHYHSHIDADGGGGGGGGRFGTGTLIIHSIDPETVTVELTDHHPIEAFGVEHSINGTFDAIRCTEEDWNDYPEYEEDDPDIGVDPGCIRPW